MRSLNRRGFLKTGITGAAGIVALSPSLISATSSEQGNKIIYRALGKTGLKIPVISFGVERANRNLSMAAYEKGIRHFDTANAYGNGKNESMIGDCLKDYPRNSFSLSTKVKLAGVSRDGKPTNQTTAEDFLANFNISLSRLKMDYVDILFVHDVRSPEIVDYKPIVRALQKLKKDGKIKFMGISTHTNEPSIINAATAKDTWDVIMTGYNFMRTDINELNSAIKKATQAGIGIVTIKSMAGGYLDKEKTKPVNSTAALKWVLSNPDITTIISGMSNFDQVDLNMKIISDISLSDDEKKDLMIASAESGLYCEGCGNCLQTCAKDLPIPDIMRAYMYAYGYANPATAQSLLGELGTSGNPCAGCDICTVECTKRFNVKEKIADISRVINVPMDFLA